MSATATNAVKTCSTCQRTLPIAEFRRRKKGEEQRHTVCRTCFNGQHRERRTAEKEKRVYTYAKAVIDARRSRNQIHALTYDLFRNFGGSKQIAKTWKDTFDKASAAKRHLVASKLLIAISDLLVLMHQEQEERQQDLERLSDEELRHLVDQQREALLMQLRQQEEA